MNILYYDWDEFNGEDCRDALKRLGHNVETVKFDNAGFELTEEILSFFTKKFSRTENGKRYYDCVFSFDYFPNISQACQKFDVPYISWIFDSPHYTLDSHTLGNSVNRVFVFDKVLYKRLCDRGVNTVHYTTLAVNSERLTKLCDQLDKETGGNIVYEHDVCFLGNLYDNEFNFYDQVKYLPPALKMYVDAVIMGQEKVFGIDLFSDPKVMSAERIAQLREYIKFEKTDKYEIDYDEVILDMLRKKVTVNERRNILLEMGKRFDTVLYTMPGAKPIENVCNLGTANYMKKMPKVFHRSKINLNITLRCILGGIPLRVVDILGAGGFLITTYQDIIAEYFTDGVELVMAATPEDMLQKTAYYLEHEEERKEIARRGQEKVLRDFSYMKLLPEIFSL
jgi:spore maturation protein CgeB